MKMFARLTWWQIVILMLVPNPAIIAQNAVAQIYFSKAGKAPNFEMALRNGAIGHRADGKCPQPTKASIICVTYTATPIGQISTSSMSSAYGKNSGSTFTENTNGTLFRFDLEARLIQAGKDDFVLGECSKMSTYGTSSNSMSGYGRIPSFYIGTGGVINYYADSGIVTSTNPLGGEVASAAKGCFDHMFAKLSGARKLFSNFGVRWNPGAVDAVAHAKFETFRM